MASRIYTIRNKATGKLTRYVRANTLAGAIRAVAEEHFSATPSSTDDIFLASKAGAFDVLDAVRPEQIDIEDEAPMQNSRMPVDA
jgi:hypothetical protein